MRARVGKVARLPHELREELNRRIRDGATGQALLDWLNGQPTVAEVLAAQFDGKAIDDENLRAWRNGGYQEWLARQERLDHTRELAAMAANLARANGASLAEGGMAIASGRLLEILEACDEKLGPEALNEVITGLTSLRAQEVAGQRVTLEHEKLKRKDEELALERQKFQRQTCELFLKWREDDRARAIAESGASNSEKIEALGQAMFGELWK